MDKHKQLLEKLISYQTNLSKISTELKQYWIWDNVLVKLESSDVVNILNKFIDGEIDNSAIVKWANLIEGRDDINYEHNQSIVDILAELAAPEVNFELTKDRAKELIDELI